MTNTTTNPIASAFHARLQDLRDKAITEGISDHARDQEGYELLDSAMRHLIRGEITPAEAEEIRDSVELFVVYNN
jgi:hypothetical protein